MYVTLRKKIIKQNEISTFCKLPKENKRNNENVFTFLIFYLLIFHFLPFDFLLFASFFFSDVTFCKEALCFIIFILPLFSNTLTLESIFEYYVKNKIKNTHFKISSRDEVVTRLFFFFHPRMKFHLDKNV